MPCELSIGTAAEIVTPDLGCQMAGFDARRGVAQGVHDDLHARTIVLDDGTTKVALVSIEVLGIDGVFATRVRNEIERRTGIPAGHVILAATHTHCGPATFNHFFNQGQSLDQAYLDRLAVGIVRSMERAFAARRKRRIRSGLVLVEGIAVNRRTVDGTPVDRQAGVLFVEELDGRPAAVAISFACHTTVLGPNTLEITADFPYYTIQQLRRELGGNTEVLFFNGAEGDVSIGHKSDLSAVGVIAPFRTFEKAEELGTRLSDGVLAGLPGLQSEDAVLGVESKTTELPLKTYLPLAAMTSRREKAAARVRALESASENDSGKTRDLLSCRQRYLFSRIEEYYASLYKHAPGAAQKTLAAELTAVRVGDTALLSFPGEVFVALGLAIRERSSFPRTIFLGLANDYIGYVPTADANAKAGYEVVASRVTADAAAVLTDGGVELLRTLAIRSCS